MSSLTAIRQALRQHVNPERAVVAPRFFKAGPGEYAEGDKFIGTSVPDARSIARKYRDLSLADVTKLLHSPWHEERLVAILMLVDRFARGDAATQSEVYELYTANTAYINNWDLVDCSAEYIVGSYLDGRPEKLEVLLQRAQSDLLWDRRIAMVATFAYIKQGRADEALVVADSLLHDDHDLIQKAVGWMLREVGKRIDHSLLADYLEDHAATMPRMTLRYALEHFTEDRRQYYLHKRRTIEAKE